FTEVIIAPDYEPEALELLRTKKKNLRILKVANPPVLGLQVHPIDGGALVQSADKIDDFGDNPQNWTLVSGEAADTDTLRDLEFAWRSLRCVKSNAILLAHDNATVGIGMGQVNRVDSCHLAVERANTLADGVERARGAVAASDAFFPFADGPQILIDAGVRAIVQPGGSIRDEEVFEAARAA
nr:bifunctional phosphoribosylaminoimidazolecarboxamide formyltransferase/IMP cyclohydrolase [Gardnerella vaginalis]